MMENKLFRSVALFILIACSMQLTDAFHCSRIGHLSTKPHRNTIKPITSRNQSDKLTTFILSAKRPSIDRGSDLSKKRREQLGVPDGEREYDLGVALDTNTDPLITKIIAGSFILAMIALLVVGVIIPSTADFGEGVCSPIQNGGRC